MHSAAWVDTLGSADLRVCFFYLLVVQALSPSSWVTEYKYRHPRRAPRLVGTAGTSSAMMDAGGCLEHGGGISALGGGLRLMEKVSWRVTPRKTSKCVHNENHCLFQCAVTP